MRLIDPKKPTNRLYVSDFVMEQMQKIPTIEAEPVKHGEWETIEDDFYMGLTMLSRGLESTPWRNCELGTKDDWQGFMVWVKRFSVRSLRKGMEATAMIVENGKIKEATTAELYERWLRQELENIMTFPEYMRAMERAGCKVIKVDRRFEG